MKPEETKWPQGYQSMIDIEGTMFALREAAPGDSNKEGEGPRYHVFSEQEDFMGRTYWQEEFSLWPDKKYYDEDAMVLALWPKVRGE